jgi:hypothetical protein
MKIRAGKIDAACETGDADHFFIWEIARPLLV